MFVGIKNNLIVTFFQKWNRIRREFRAKMLAIS